jgi:hypothetical protein
MGLFFLQNLVIIAIIAIIALENQKCENKLYFKYFIQHIYTTNYIYNRGRQKCKNNREVKMQICISD